MCVAFCITASMLAWEGMGYTSGSIILLSNLMSTIMHPLRVLSALVVKAWVYEWRGITPLHVSLLVELIKFCVNYISVFWYFWKVYSCPSVSL